MQTTDTFEHRLTQYRTLEAKIEAMEAEFKVKLAPYNEAREKLRAHLLDMLNKSGQESAKTAAGTVYKTVRQSASLDDPEAFKRHVIGSENWDLLDWKANKTAALDFAAANDGQLPPGVKITAKLDIGVRAPAKPRGAGKTTSAGNAEETAEAA